MIHYKIKLIGKRRSPRRPWLGIDMDGNEFTINPYFHFSGESFAHKFSTLKPAKEWLDYLKSVGHEVFMTWHDDAKKPKCGTFGEVNRDYLARI
jgi:hypothetical protein